MEINSSRDVDLNQAHKKLKVDGDHQIEDDNNGINNNSSSSNLFNSLLTSSTLLFGTLPQHNSLSLQTTSFQQHLGSSTHNNKNTLSPSSTHISRNVYSNSTSPILLSSSPMSLSSSSTSVSMPPPPPPSSAHHHQHQYSTTYSNSNSPGSNNSPSHHINISSPLLSKSNNGGGLTSVVSTTNSTMGSSKLVFEQTQQPTQVYRPPVKTSFFGSEIVIDSNSYHSPPLQNHHHHHQPNLYSQHSSPPNNNFNHYTSNPKINISDISNNNNNNNNKSTLSNSYNQLLSISSSTITTTTPQVSHNNNHNILKEGFKEISTLSSIWNQQYHSFFNDIDQSNNNNSNSSNLNIGKFTYEAICLSIDIFNQLKLNQIVKFKKADEPQPNNNNIINIVSVLEDITESNNNTSGTKELYINTLNSNNSNNNYNNNDYSWIFQLLENKYIQLNSKISNLLMTKNIGENSTKAIVEIEVVVSHYDGQLNRELTKPLKENSIIKSWIQMANDLKIVINNSPPPLSLLSTIACTNGGISPTPPSPVSFSQQHMLGFSSTSLGPSPSSSYSSIITPLSLYSPSSSFSSLPTQNGSGGGTGDFLKMSGSNNISLDFLMGSRLKSSLDAIGSSQSLNSSLNNLNSSSSTLTALANTTTSSSNSTLSLSSSNITLNKSMDCVFKQKLDEFELQLKGGLSVSNTLMEEMESPKQLKLQLRSYQKQALHWMFHRERSVPEQAISITDLESKDLNFIRGGLLCDDMGMGKTIEIISLILANPSTNPTEKSTLIVCPVSVLQQWYNEITTHTNPPLTVYIYHGPGRIKDSQHLLSYDVILTTYTTLSAEYSDDMNNGNQTSGIQYTQLSNSGNTIENSNNTDKKRKRQSGQLSQSGGTIDVNQPMQGLINCKWFRVVLDEAHTIKERSTRSSKAASYLESTIRWCVTGTPIQNKLDDIYSLLHFLRVEPFHNYYWWNQYILKPSKLKDDRGFTRLRVVLAKLLLRRVKDQKLNDNTTPILNLPDRNIHIKQDTFSEEEEQIYQELWNSAKSKFNTLFANGSLLKNYAHILELLLRLRQVCNHPFLIKSKRLQYQNQVSSSSPSSLEESTNSDKTIDEFSTLLDHLNKNPNSHSPLELGKKLKRILGKGIKDQDCSICLETLDNPSITACGHLFCTNCINLNYYFDNELSEINNNNINNSNISSSNKKQLSRSNSSNNINNLIEPPPPPPPTPTTPSTPTTPQQGGGPVPNLFLSSKSINLNLSLSMIPHYESPRNVHMDEIEPSSPLTNPSTPLPYNSDKQPEKQFKCPICKEINTCQMIRQVAFNSSSLQNNSNSSNNNSNNNNNNSNVKKSKKKWIDDNEWKTSTKIESLLEELEKVFTTEPQSKCLIFSQWTSMLDLVEIPLRHKSYEFVRLDGKVTQKQREVCIKRFKEESQIKIFLISMKAGGLGLNLVEASHVFLLDPWWNPSTEEQAIDRVYRIGQNKNVNVTRFFIKNTIEERILRLQAEKKNLARDTLQVKKQIRIDELKLLFSDHIN
ncbi:SNF2-related domain-containing protein [Tieghemostelium lacteum]|uniref:SNF2-related domain-containing protein n=1 Tax=Tieghemostelium lacteum TaxID=361077 RepID=A0A151ZEF2_TIELA|nr:SNF2-related domain-containing protein [Tieghemostelium lacteum]|eukprot:KYQ92342.1 SNF2-related domain-containing protein [Tieghemostelium lacteum]